MNMTLHCHTPSSPPGRRIIERILFGACLQQQLFKCDTIWTSVQTVSNLNSSLHMRHSNQLFRHMDVWTAVQTATRLNSTENVMLCDCMDSYLLFQNLASGHQTIHLNIHLPLHSRWYKNEQKLITWYMPNHQHIIPIPKPKGLLH